jgi:multimeric flavodoxin WrbA
MKVVAFNGSARKQGNTAFLIRQTMKTLGVNMAWLLRKLYG